MKIKACLLVPFLLLTTACGHLRPSDEAVATPHDSGDVTVSSETGANVEIIDDNLENPEIVLSDAESAAIKVTPEQADDQQHQDIFDRLRAGFRFPDFKSKYTAEYEHWDATHPTYLTNLFARATPFLHHIVEELEKRDMPMELALLPAVESAYKPEAMSRSRAGGLWQFIPSTGRQFGLRQDWWYDGRRDALASTNAALDYLQQLNKMFDGDWFLTLAAYNAGPGTVMRARKRNESRRKKTDYQSLKLRNETVRYVPKLIALKNIINDPDAFNVTLPEITSQPYFEVLELPGQIDLKQFARDAEIDPALLRHLNAGFKRWATSPDGPHRLLVPIGDGEIVNRAQQAIANAPSIRYRNHRIARGDTLSGIARRHGVSVVALKKANNLSTSRIREGRDLLIPVSGDYLLAASDAEPDSEVVHRVQRGDTLWSIARRYKVKMQELMAWNNIARDQILKLNQSLLVRPRSFN